MKRNGVGATGGQPVVAGLRRFIRARGLVPGDRLPSHRQLCDELGVGPRSLREALSVLGAEGVIRTNRRGGTTLVQPTVDGLSGPLAWHLESTGYTFEDVVRARAAVEAAVAYEAAQHRTPRDLLHILDAVESMQSGSGTAASPDERFHQAVLAAAHNPVLALFGQLISAQFTLKASASRAVGPRVRRETVREHERIYRFVLDQDRARARDAMYAHVLKQLRRMNG